MSSHRELLILGDSNVKRFYSRIGLTQAQSLDFVQARNMTEVESALAAVKNTYKIVVLAFLTNLVIDAGDGAVNDVDRMSSIEEAFNTVVPLIRFALGFRVFVIYFNYHLLVLFNLALRHFGCAGMSQI